MQDYIEIIEKWSSAEPKMALARVIKTWGSSPRPAGSIMLVNPQGDMAGSVSGGCVEGSVVKQSLQLIEDGKAKKVSYGVSDEDAWSVGLSCGGSIQVFLESVDFSTGTLWDQLLTFQQQNKSCILISSLEDGHNVSSLIDLDGNQWGDHLPDAVIEAAHQAYDQRVHSTFSDSDKDYFIQLFPRKPQLLVIGAAHVTVDLVDLGHQFGFETIVIDPRGYFAEKTTFRQQPDQVLNAYPSEVLSGFPLDAFTFCAILSHDPKIDDNALEVLLPSKVGYIGALGSRKTHAKRTKRLSEKGISQEMIDRIAAPIGVSIHAKSAKEIALAIMAQIIAAKNQHL